jgi:hypothetical protein
MHRFRPANIQEHWADILPALESIAVHNDWEPEHIYVACLGGSYNLWMCEDGFIIVGISINQFNDNRELFVWICHSLHSDGITEYFDDISEMAKDLECQVIKFISHRKGFEKVAKSRKWQSNTQYTITV